MNSRTRRYSRALLVVFAAGTIALMTSLAGALSSVTATDVAPSIIKRSSAQVTVFNVNLTTNAALSDTLTGAKVTFNESAGTIAESDFAADTAGAANDGVQLWRDNGGTADALDPADTAVSTGFEFSGTTATLELDPAQNEIPTAAEGAATYLVVIRTSSSISNADAFTVTLPQDAFTTSPVPTSLNSPNGVTSKTITADTVAPDAPVVANLGLSKSVGKVRSGSTAASTETSGVLEVLKSSNPGCTSGVTSVTEGPSMDLTLTNTDLVGTTTAQTEALQALAPTSPATYLCYRVRDVAGNTSTIVADGVIPAAPAAGDPALLSVSNVTGQKKAYAGTDASGPRTLRVFIRPGGTGLDRAVSSTGAPVDVTTSTTGGTNSGTTDIRRATGGATLAAADGIAYALVNADGNDGATVDDGTIPAAPVSGDLGILGTSAADSHQRITAAQDTTARTFGVYVDPAGGTAWARGVTTESGTTPVRVTTSTSGATSSSSTSVYAGATQLAATHAVGYVAVGSSGGHESDVLADGVIPAGPTIGDITFSDARNLFVVSTNPYPADTKFALYVGADDSTAATAYDGEADGTASSNTAVGVEEFEADQKLFYTLINPQGNESVAVQDGTIPAAPATEATDLLGTSAVLGHQRVIAQSDGSGARTFRLYVDTDPGETPSYKRAFTTSGGNTLVEITTANGSIVSTSTTSIFSGATGTTQLGDGDAVGFARDDTDGNESDVAGDSTIPAAPGAATTRVSDAEDKIYASTATATNNVNLFLDASSQAATAYGNNADKTLTAAVTAFGADVPEGQFVYYTTYVTTSGNESTMAADGSVPLADATLADVMSVSAATGVMTSNLDPDAPRTVHIFGNPPGGDDVWVLGTTTSGGSTPVTVLTSETESVDSDPGIFFGTSAIGAGDAVAYGIADTSGNDADYTTDGTVPAAPADADHFSASAASGTATIAAAAPSGVYHLYVDGDGLDFVTHTNGFADTVVHAFDEEDAIGWALTLSGNESPLLTDGTIPLAPDAASLSASARTDQIVALDATATNEVLAFAHGVDSPTAAYADGADVTISSSSPASFATTAGDFLFYTVVNATSDNESPVTADGSIPATPSLPAAATLVAAGDGGTGAPAATINSVGDDAVTLRPGIALDEGEALRLAVTKSPTTVVGTATSASATPVTPVFGGATTDVTYGSTGQDADTGSLDLSALADGSDLATVVSLTNGDGNESESSTAVNLVKDTTSPDPVSDTSITPATPSKDATPAVGGTFAAGTSAVTVTFDSTNDDNDRTVTATLGDTTFSVTDSSYTTGLADDTYVVTAVAQDEVGNPSSSATTVSAAYVVDTVAAAPGAPDLASSSDTGESSTDNITNDATPSFNVSGAEANATVRLFEGATQLGEATADGTGAATVTASTLSDGIHSLTVKQEDAATNTSAASPALSVRVDTVAPTATLAVPTSLKSGGVWSYSETVRGPGTTNTAVRLAGGATNINGSVTCANSNGTVVSCAGGTVKFATISTVVALIPGQSYESYTGLTAGSAISDVAGNAVAQTKSAAWRASLNEQENTFAHTATWGYVKHSSALGGSYTRERFPSRADFTFNGSYVVWYTVIAPNQGIADVYIDNVFKGRFDQYSAGTKFLVPRGWTLPNGTHTLSIIPRGIKRSASSGTWVAIDGIRVGATLYNTPAVKYVWGAQRSTLASGGYYQRTDQFGADYKFTFRGTAVNWYTMVGRDQGKANVYIDGVFKGTVDNYASSTSFTFRRYAGLTNAVHTIRIYVLGQHRAGGTGNLISVDRWAVT